EEVFELFWPDLATRCKSMEPVLEVVWIRGPSGRIFLGCERGPVIFDLGKPVMEGDAACHVRTHPG
ncbi:MAG: hypothetical protein WCJ14_06380, partial [Verrucomicrobiota bacterium]